MTDAELIRRFAEGERRWLVTLGKLRDFHVERFGRTASATQWIGGVELGRFSWLGFYWPTQFFWFGYGFHGHAWQPLIEVDDRSASSVVIRRLQAEHCGPWRRVDGGVRPYLRLWSELPLAADSAVDLDWFQARSRELHEYVVVPEL